MSKKIDLLYNKVSYNFITGKYGIPKIPDENEILNKIKEITQDNNDPIMNNKKMDDIYIETIRNNFDATIDDIDILYESIEDQSNSIMEQLTNSLKEHNGVKRELRNIETRAVDIQAGKMGKDYLKYIFTEKFLNINNINTIQTTTDSDTKAPIIDTKSGTAYIPNALMNLVDLTHYYGRKIDIINTGYTGHIIDSGYEGHADVGTILNINDPRRLTYRVKTSEPTSLKSSFVIQLSSDRTAIAINTILIQLDADSLSGQLKIEYKTPAGWKSIPDFPQKILDVDKINFKFADITTTHLKFQFIKEYPDFIDSNEYFIIIDSLVILRADTHKTATIYSKSLKIEPYDNEKVVIKNIAVNANGYIPDGCSVNVYVAKDKLIKGYFLDTNNNYVFPNSIHVDHFVQDNSNLYPERYILLSDIKNNPEATGVIDYNQLEFDWKIVKTFNEFDNLKPAIVDFTKLSTKEKFNNNLYNEAPYLFGDPLYYSTYSEYPQPGLGYDSWFLSGVIDDTNPFWDTYLSGYAQDGLLISGHDYGDPTGYPFNYYIPDLERTLRFGDNHKVLNGWWRPSVQNVTSSGIMENVTIEDPKPDFYFNGMRFYKIYKIGSNDTPVGTSVKLYSYQDKPIIGGANDYYPNNLIWNYNSKTIIKTAEFTTINGWIDVNQTFSLEPPQNNAFNIPLESGQDLITDSIREVHYEGHSNLLTIDTHYHTFQDTGKWYMAMLPISSGTIYHPDAHIKFKYSYKYEDKYTSYWEGYIIADNDSNIIINQVQLAAFMDLSNTTLTKSSNVVGLITIQTLTGEPIYDNVLLDKNITIDIAKGIYKIRIFCLSNPTTNYSANYWSPHSNNHLETGPDIRLVPRVEPIKLTDFNILLYSTPYENDNRASIMDDVDGNKYIVVKEPSRNVLPGYYFDKFKKSYIKESNNLIRNIGHYKRDFLYQIGASGYYTEQYITGSSGNIIMSGDYLDFNSYTQDTLWNAGYLYPAGFQNFNPNILYPQHSTFGNGINVEDTVTNKGHLFYNTAENLPAFYTIEYGNVDKHDYTVDRFLYKIQLNSEHETNTPIIQSLKFTINEEEEI